jgi:hypothetical protein
VLDLADVTLGDLARVGGKNASLGELFAALKPHWSLLKCGDLEARLHTISLNPDVEIATTIRIAAVEAVATSETVG